EFADTQFQTSVCGILVDEQDSASMTESQTVQSLGSEINCLPDKIRYKARFVVPGIKSLPLKTESTLARFRIRASHEVALSTEHLEHFLSIPELTKVVSVTLSSAITKSAHSNNKTR